MALLMRIYLLHILLCLFATKAEAIAKDTSIENRLMELYEKSSSALDSHIDSALYYAQLLEQEAKSHNDIDWIEKASFQIGVYHRLNGEFEKARERFNRYLQYAEGKELVNEQAMALFQLSHEVTGQKNTEEYLTTINRAIDLFRQAGNIQMLTSTLVNKGMHLRRERLYDQATEVLDEAWQHSVSINDSLLMSQVLNTQGVLIAAQGKFDESIEYFAKDVEINRKSNNPRALSGALGNLGFANLRANRITEGEKHIKEALTIRRKMGGPYEISMSLVQLAEVNVLQRKWKDALQYSLEAQEIATNKNLKSVREQCYRQLAHIYENMNDHKEALRLFKNYTFLKDSLLNDQINQNAQKVEAAYQVADKEKQILKLEYEDQLQANRLKQQRIALVAALAILGLLSWLLYRFYGQNKKIKSQNTIITKANAEKETLLKEIHHRVKNNLQVISSLLGLQSLSIKDDAAKIAIQEGRARVHSMSLIHQSLYKKDNLTGIKMSQYVQKLANDLVRAYQVDNTDIRMEYQVDEALTLDVETVVPIGLILNELITNALKYAFDDTRSKGVIRILLSEESDHLLLSVSDDGVGITTSADSNDDGSFGLNLIKAFQSKLEADMSIKSDRGTTVTLKMKNYRVC